VLSVKKFCISNNPCSSKSFFDVREFDRESKDKRCLIELRRETKKVANPVEK